MIQKLAKAHYLCINIECGKDVLAELETGFRFNDAVLRHLTVLQDEAVTAPSIMMKMVEREDSRKSAPVSDRGDRGPSDRPPQDRAPQERTSQEA
jgi:small subunit ribosomal protein S6